MNDTHLNLHLWPRQMQAFETEATELLFGGATEGGKSHLIRVALIAWCLAIPGLQCVLIRKKYDDIIRNHLEGRTGFRTLLAPLIKTGQVTITQNEIRFPNGSIIAFQHCFTGDTLIETTQGLREIKSLMGQDGQVKVSKSFTCEFTNVRLTRQGASIVLVKFEDGSLCRCTPDHKFLTEQGFVEAKNLKGVLCLTNESSLSIQQLKNLKGKVTPKKINITDNQQQDCTELFGNLITEVFQKVSRFIIKMKIETTTRLKTLNCLRGQCIESYMQVLNAIGCSLKSQSLRQLRRLGIGIVPLPVTNGTNNKSLKYENTCLIKCANPAEQSIKDLRNIEVAVENVGQDYTDLKRKRCVDVSPAGIEDVYCLTVPHIGIFPLANGVLVSNCQDDRQFDSAQGVEKHVLIIDEATQIPERLIRFFRTWVRMSIEMKETLPEEWKGKFPRIIYTANPIGISVPFFKRKFVELCPDEKIVEVEGFKRQYLLSRYTDNLSVDVQDHIGRLQGIGDEQLAKALDEGNWNAITGEFFPEWNEDRHVVADFIPPLHWFQYRGFDWGTAEPFCVLYVAVSDGESFIDSDGRKRWFPRGALIIYNEWYGCDEEHPEKGNRMRNEDIAQGIIERAQYEHRNVITLSDSLPFQDRGGETIAITFQKNGCPLTLADTSRVPGWSQMRSRLIGIKYDSNSEARLPMIYFCQRCKYCRDYIPALTRHKSEGKKQDATEHGEATHANDTVRIISMAHTVIKDRLEPMQAQIERYIKQSKPTMKKILSASGENYLS